MRAPRKSERRDLVSGERRALGVDVERVERLARGHEQSVALDAAEAEVGAALGQQEAADQLPVGSDDRPPVQALAAAPPAPEIAVGVAAYAVWESWPRVDEQAAAGEPGPAVDDVEHADLPRSRPAHDHVELRLVRRKAKSVGARY